MSVYVDDMSAPLGRMRMCHMIADTHEELMAMAEKLLLLPFWLQNPGTYHEHFDIAKSKRARAIELGAVPITQRDLGRKILEKENIGREKKNS